jgi:ABC-type methionine transport system ATPase subunit
MNEGLLLAAIVENVSTRRDGTLKITFGCQEMSSSKSGELVSMQNKVIAIYISPKETIPQSVLDTVDSVDIDMPGKTKSQRQRAVLYRIWELQKEGHKTFESFYAYKMEAHISDLKGVLDSLTND